MNCEYISLDTDPLFPNDETVLKKLRKLLTKHRILASILGLLVTALSVSLIVVSIKGASLSTPTAVVKEEPCFTDECVLSAGYLSSSMDLNVRPCDDFYKYTCGKWQEDHPFPANVDGWSHFYKLSYGMRTDLIKLLNDIEDNETSDPKALSKLYNFYKGCVNQTTRNSSGYSSLMSKLNDIGGWPLIDRTWDGTHYRWQDSVIKLIKTDLFPIFRVIVTKELINTSKTILEIGPMSSDNLRLNDKSFANDLIAVIQELTKHIKSFELNKTEIIEDLNLVKNLTQSLGNAISKSHSALYYQQNYSHFLKIPSHLDHKLHNLKIKDILKQTFDINEYDDKVFIPDIDYLREIDKILLKTDKRVLANYLAMSFVFNYGQYTSIKLLEIIGGEMLDAPEVLPNICYDSLEALLPNLLSRFYVDNYFKNSRNQTLSDMRFITDLVYQSFHQSLNDNEWMDSETRLAAIHKLEKMSQNIAFPEWTMDNSTLDQYYEPYSNISPEDFFASVLSISEGKHNQSVLELKGQLFKDSKLNSWPSHDATYVNAFYYFSTNGIYFPAGIAQYPFYTMGRPIAMNLGAIGMLIAHEMTHAFDLNGRQYDSDGNLRNWWSNSTEDLFLNKSQCFVDQYNSYQFPEQKMKVNGRLTLNENIADNGGIRESYRALMRYQEIREYETTYAHNDQLKFKRLPGIMSNFTEEQLFFISFANMWCANMVPTYILQTLKSSNHPPESVRVNGPLSNLVQFSHAFNCKPGDNLYKSESNRCVLW